MTGRGSFRSWSSSMVSSVLGLAILGVAIYLVLTVVYAGGYRQAHTEALLTRYREAQEEYQELRRLIRRRYTREAQELAVELGRHLQRLEELRHAVLAGVDHPAPGEGQPSTESLRRLARARSDQVAATIRRMIRRESLASPGDCAS